MEDNKKANKKVKDTLKKLESNISEYEHYDGKINKEPVDKKTGTAIYNYRDTLRLMENKKVLK